jgi:hypothetical protein
MSEQSERPMDDPGAGPADDDPYVGDPEAARRLRDRVAARWQERVKARGGDTTPAPEDPEEELLWPGSRAPRGGPSAQTPEANSPRSVA